MLYCPECRHAFCESQSVNDAEYRSAMKQLMEASESGNQAPEGVGTYAAPARAEVTQTPSLTLRQLMILHRVFFEQRRREF